MKRRLPDSDARWDDFSMSEKIADGTQDHGPHQHAHAAPTTQQMRTVGQRRREAEEKLEHHLQEARHKDDPHGDTVPESEGAGPMDSGDVAAVHHDDD
jgi:hypothetical protein